MTRTEYHREYYWRNVEKRREQRASSKRRAKHNRLQKLLASWRHCEARDSEQRPGCIFPSLLPAAR